MVQYRAQKPSPWIVQYREGGEVKTRSFRVKDDAVRFEASRVQMRQLTRAGLEAPDQHLLFSDWVAFWLSRRFKNPELTFATVSADEGRLRNYWLEKFGNRPLPTLMPQEIEDHLDWIQYELEHSSADRNRHRALIHKLLRDAFKAGKIIHNPAARTELVREVRTRKRTWVKDEGDLEAYLAALYSDRPSYGILGELLAFTGCRICEAIGLQYQDIDEERGTITFRRIEERAGGSKIVERTKGVGEGAEEDEIHVVPLFPRLRDALRRHRQQSTFRKPTDFVATTERGDYVGYDTFKDAHKRAAVHAGIPEITPHSIRRTFSTYAKKAGFTRSERRELLGHSSEAVTARYDMKDVDHLARKGRELGFASRKPKLRRVK